MNIKPIMPYIPIIKPKEYQNIVNNINFARGDKFLSQFKNCHLPLLNRFGRRGDGGDEVLIFKKKGGSYD